LVVSDISTSALPSGTLSATGGPQHLLDLTSIEDDVSATRFGSSGRSSLVAKSCVLPLFRGRSQIAWTHLTVWTLSSTRCAGVQSRRPTRRALQAPFRSGITIEDYQLTRS